MNLVLIIIISFASYFTESTSWIHHVEYSCASIWYGFVNEKCEWRIDGNVINISRYNYEYANENSSCIIKGQNKLPPTIRCFHLREGQLFKPFTGLTEEITFMVEATYAQNNSRHEYNCNFDTKIDHCHWNINGSNYNWVDDLHYATAHEDKYGSVQCKIIGNETANKLTGVHCVGTTRKIMKTAAIDEAIELPCITSKRVNCKWIRNDVEIHVNGGHSYGYPGSHGGINTTDCSITIEQVKASDEGNWTCNSNTLKEIKYHLRVGKYDERTELEALYQYDCHFDVAVDNYQWMISFTSTINISSYKYEYVKGNGTSTLYGRMTGDTNAMKMPNNVNCMGIKMGQLINADYMDEIVWLERKPIASIVNWGGGYHYECSFRAKVSECSWNINGSTMEISHYGYHYIKDDRLNNVNCTIKGSKLEIPLPETVNCIGKAETTVVTAAISDAVKLKCNTRNRVDCLWTRNNARMAINGMYEFIKDANEIDTFSCSISIKRVKAIDRGEWICMGKITEHGSPQMVRIYRLNIDYNQLLFEKPFNKETIETVAFDSTHVLLDGLCAFLAFVVFIIIVCICCRRKLKNVHETSANYNDNELPLTVKPTSSRAVSYEHLKPRTTGNKFDAIIEPFHEEVN